MMQQKPADNNILKNEKMNNVTIYGTFVRDYELPRDDDNQFMMDYDYEKMKRNGLVYSSVHIFILFLSIENQLCQIISEI